MHSRGCLMDDPYIDNTTERSMNRTRKAKELVAGSALDAALSAPAAPVAQGEPVAEVIWHDPDTDIFPQRPGKIIDASIAFMDSAPIGTKLYAAPSPAPASQPVSEPVKAQPLTDEQIMSLSVDCYQGGYVHPLVNFARAIERAHGIGQGGA